MQIAKTSEYIRVEDYLAGELISEVKHEYVDGQVFAMSGASKNHVRIVQNLSKHFGIHLDDSPCEPMASDMKVKTSSSKYRYPDFMVVCDETDENEYFTDTPVILVEVLSRSTRKIDEQIKRIEYINLPSLQEYVIIEQYVADISVFRKKDQWQPTHYFLGDDITFESIGLTLAVEELYKRVDNQDVNEWLQNMARA